MSRAARSLLALCLLLVAVAVGASVAAGAPQAADPSANETRADQSNESGTETNATSSANGTVTVRNVTVWTGKPAVRDRLDNWSAYERAKRDGSLTRSRWVIPTETLVLELRATGLDRRLAAAEGQNITERFFDATFGPDSAITLRQTQSTAELHPVAAPLNQTGATRVVANPDRDTYALVLSPKDLRGQRVEDDELPRPIRPVRGRLRDWYGLNVTLDGNTSLFRPTDHDSPKWLYRIPDLSADVVTPASDASTGLPPRSNQSLRVEGSLPDGANVTLRLRNRSDDGPPIVRSVRVRGDRVEDRHDGPRWNATGRTTFDLSGFAPGTTFEMQILVRDWPVTDLTGSIRPRSRFISMPDRSRWQDGRVRVPHVTLQEDGFLVAMRGNWSRLVRSEGEDQYRYLGHEALEAGVYENVTIETKTGLTDPRADDRPITVVAVVDSNNNGRYDANDTRYVENGRLVGATVPSVYSDASGEGPAWADAGSQAPRPGLTPTPARTKTERTDTGTEPVATTSGTGPGFGSVTVFGAIAVLLASAGWRCGPVPLGTRR